LPSTTTASNTLRFIFRVTACFDNRIATIDSHESFTAITSSEGFLHRVHDTIAVVLQGLTAITSSEGFHRVDGTVAEAVIHDAIGIHTISLLLVSLEFRMSCNLQ